LKCLSVCQPFADLIVEGKKTIELRNWNTKFRGEFLVHSAKKIRNDDCKRLGIAKNFVTGAIIGKVELYDVKKYLSEQELKKDSKFHFAKINFNGKKYGFLLQKAKKFHVSIPYKGQLGFFDVDLPTKNMTKNEMLSEIIDEEYRYQWIGHH